MGKNAIETVIGAIVLLIAGGFLLTALQTVQVESVEGYEIEAAFLKVGGLQKGADVRINGIKVGSVTASVLDPETFDAVVKMTISSDIKVPSDSVASIVSGGIMGGKYIRLEPGQQRDEFLASGDRVSKTKDFRSLEDQVGDIIFLATGNEG